MKEAEEALEPKGGAGSSCWSFLRAGKRRWNWVGVPHPAPGWGEHYPLCNYQSFWGLQGLLKNTWCGHGFLVQATGKSCTGCKILLLGMQIQWCLFGKGEEAFEWKMVKECLLKKRKGLWTFMGTCHTICLCWWDMDHDSTPQKSLWMRVVLHVSFWPYVVKVAE